MQFGRFLAAGAVGLFSIAVTSLPALASASLGDYSYCVDYGYPNFGDCASSYSYGGYYGGGYGYGYYPSYDYYYYPQTYSYTPQPQMYYQQQYSYSNYPQTFYQPTTYSYVVPTVNINNGYNSGYSVPAYYSGNYYGY